MPAGFSPGVGTGAAPLTPLSCPPTTTTPPLPPPTSSPSLTHTPATAATPMSAASQLVPLMPPLLRHPDAAVRARSCNLLGNLCRHRWVGGRGRR
jgi:hypothetical protein